MRPAVSRPLSTANRHAALGRSGARLDFAAQRVAERYGRILMSYFKRNRKVIEIGGYHMSARCKFHPIFGIAHRSCAAPAAASYKRHRVP
jgi:hypothetical protein